MKKLLIALMGVALFTFTACDWEDPHQDMLEEFGRGDYGQSTSGSIIFSGSDGNVIIISTSDMSGSNTVSFNSNVAWTASFASTTRADGDPDWFDFNPKSGKAGNVEMTITVDANDTHESREGAICITAGTAKSYISIKQSQDDVVIVTKTDYYVAAAGDEIQVEVKANVDSIAYQIVDDWIMDADTRAMVSQGFNFYVSKNDTIVPREGHIVFYSTLSYATDTVTIHQEPKDSVSIVNDYIDVPFKGGNFNVPIQTNLKDLEYDVIYDDENAGWLSLVQTPKVDGFDTYNFEFTAQDNTDKFMRTASLVFSSASAALSDTVKIYLIDGKDYLAITNLSSDGHVDVQYIFGDDSMPELQRSYNKKYWDDIDALYQPDGSQSWFYIPQGETVYIRAKDKNESLNGWKINLITFHGATCKLSGNVMSLLDKNVEQKSFNGRSEVFKELFSYTPYFNKDFPGSTSALVDASELKLPVTELTSYCYSNMFYGCSKLETAPGLPATKLADHCYYNMFSGCTSLAEAPELPAEELAAFCYQCMFYGCSSLTAVPEKLPAEKLAFYCYNAMFNDCSSLTVAPELPAEELAEGCYQNMFYGCSSLTAVQEELPAEKLAKNCYSYMFGRCTNLTTAPVLPATRLTYECYNGMFSRCTNLTAAPSLPAKELAEGCYMEMFQECSHLTAAPVLPATTLANKCYENMFNGCSSLTVAPVLSATTLTSECYFGMFSGCTSLTAAPTLPATKLASYCYAYMFKGCTNLNSINVYFTDWNTTSTTSWVNGVSEDGTFTCPSALSPNWDPAGDYLPSATKYWDIKYNDTNN